jgi:hypothetical protein
VVKRHAPGRSLPPGKDPGTNRIGGWVCLRAGLHTGWTDLTYAEICFCQRRQVLCELVVTVLRMKLASHIHAVALGLLPYATVRCKLSLNGVIHTGPAALYRLKAKICCTEGSTFSL